MFKFLSVLGAGVLVTGGAWAQTESYLTAPANPNLQPRAPRYAPVTAGVKRFGVVEPKDWRELNQAVGPQPGSSGGHGSMPGMGMSNGRRDTGGR